MQNKDKTLAISRGVDELKKLVPFMGLIILFVLFTLTTDGKFIDIKNLRNIISQSAITMVAAVGCCFVMAHNNLDFSLGGACAMSAVISMIICSYTSYKLMLPICLLIGVLCDTATCLLHIKIKIPAFIGGMCIMFAGRGLAQGAAAEYVMNLPKEYKVLQNVWFYLVVVVGVYAVAYVIFEFTKIGKYNKLIGSNPRCAELSGIHVERYKMAAFAISGLLVGVAAFMTLIRGGGANMQTGNSLETNVLLSLTLGGFPLSGGSASRIRCAIVGTFTYYVLNNGLQLWGMDPSFIYIVKGLVFLTVVCISMDRNSGNVTI